MLRMRAWKDSEYWTGCIRITHSYHDHRVSQLREKSIKAPPGGWRLAADVEPIPFGVDLLFLPHLRNRICIRPVKTKKIWPIRKMVDSGGGGMFRPSQSRHHIEQLQTNQHPGMNSLSEDPADTLTSSPIQTFSRS